MRNRADVDIPLSPGLSGVNISATAHFHVPELSRTRLLLGYLQKLGDWIPHGNRAVLGTEVYSIVSTCMSE
jgi:hypothetical protein